MMRALLLQADSGADHFAGVDAHLASLGVEALRTMPDTLPPELPAGVGVVAVADTLRPESIAAIRSARARGVPTLLLMDGIVEWRNTFTNPRVNQRFLRPAPVGMIACAGWIDRCKLRGWGNAARATGLPRLGAEPERAALGERPMIATARRPSFSREEHDRLVSSLGALRDACERLGLEPIWRVGGELSEELGVTRDVRPLAESLRDARSVVTTISTLLIESMRAGRPTAILHPHDTPLWHSALAVWRPHEGDAPTGDALIERLMSTTDAELARQDRLLASIHRSGDPSRRVAELIGAMARRAVVTPPRPLPVFGRALAPAPRTGRGGLLRVCVIDGHACTTESDARERARRAAAASPGSHPGRTLVVLTDPRAERLTDSDRIPAPGEHVLTLDPTHDHTARLESLLDAVRSIAPVHIDPGGSDIGRFLAPARRDGIALESAARWNKPWSDDPDASRRWIIAELERRGHVSVGARDSGAHDALVFEETYTPELHARVRELRRRGVGVAVAPALIPPAWVIAAVQMGDMLGSGAKRLAVFGAGAHTRRLARLFERDLPIVAILDDQPMSASLHGRPVVTPDEGMQHLGVDGVLISSDAHEPVLWARCDALRLAGIQVRTIYSGAGPSWLDAAPATALPERKSA